MGKKVFAFPLVSPQEGGMSTGVRAEAKSTQSCGHITSLHDVCLTPLPQGWHHRGFSQIMGLDIGPEGQWPCTLASRAPT